MTAFGLLTEQGLAKSASLFERHFSK